METEQLKCCGNCMYSICEYRDSRYTCFLKLKKNYNVRDKVDSMVWFAEVCKNWETDN